MEEDRIDLMTEMKKTGVVPVVVLEDAGSSIPTAKALLAGGVNFMEITFRTSAALEALKRVAAACKEMHVGAGTILNAAKCEEAIEAGAEFIVSPGFSKETIALCQKRNIPVLPGCATPTEIMAAMECGIRTVKFFPANVYGGIGAMKALSAPFTEISFVPTGGISEENLSEYIKQPFVHAVGGSWLCAKKDIAEGNFSKITDLCREAKAKTGGNEK